jgi:hypothetical protein
MAVTLDRLRPYLDDYAKITGQPKEKFVCPLTHRECDVNELIEGHILNGKLHKASRRTIVQWAKPDNFYGSRVEPAIIDYLNAKDVGEFGLVPGAHAIQIQLLDGAEYEAIPLKDEVAAHKIGERFPVLDMNRNGQRMFFAIKADRDDPKITHLKAGQAEIAITRKYLKTHWAAGMLKAAYLTVFDMLGYAAVFDPFGDSLRRQLAQYFYDNARSEDAPTYFREFANATMVMGKGEKLPAAPGDYEKLEFDTLDDRKLLFHFTPGEIMFAATCVFKINDVTVSATIPQSTRPAPNIAVAVDFYDRLMRGDADLRQIVRVAEYKVDHWDVGRKGLNVVYPPKPSASA